MRISLNIQWRDYQQNTINKILKSAPGTIHVIKSPRQSGKSTMLEALLLKTSISNEGAVSIFVSPTVRQCKKVFRELKRMVENLPVCKTTSESTMDINFNNNSQIIFLSGESDISALQGYTVKNGGFLIFDEAAFIYEDVFQALYPSTEVYKAKTIMTSTPRFRTGEFYDIFNDPSPLTIAHDWKNCTILTQEKLDFYRNKLPLNTFKNYYLGEWAEFGSNVFGDVSSCISNEFDKNLPCVMGIDWSTGSGGDDTAICLFNTKGEMVKIECFNDRNTTETIEYIIELAKQYSPTKIQVELNSIGRVFYDLLSKELKAKGIQSNLIGFNTSNTSKNKLVDNFTLAVQKNEVTILNNEKLLHQISVFESKPTQSGKVTYAASKNNHDDAVLAMLLAYDCLKTGSYSYI